MDDGAPGAADRLEGAPDQLLARLGQHLDGDVVGDQLLVDELRARNRNRSARPTGKPTSISLKPMLHQECRTCGACARAPSARSAPGCRRADRRCTRWARLVDDAPGPAPVGQVDGREGAVLVAGLDLHVLLRCGAGRKGGTPVMDCLDLWDGGKDGCRAAANQARQPPLSRSRRAARKARRRRAEYRDFMLQ